MSGPSYAEKSILDLYLIMGNGEFKVVALEYLGYGNTVGEGVLGGLITANDYGSASFTDLGLNIVRRLAYLYGLRLGLLHLRDGVYNRSRAPWQLQDGYVDAAKGDVPYGTYPAPRHPGSRFSITTSYDPSNPLH